RQAAGHGQGGTRGVARQGRDLSLLHPRISVNGVCFPRASLQEDIAAWRSLGAHTVVEHVRKLADVGCADGVVALRGAGVRVEALVHPLDVRLDDPRGWEKFRAEFRRSIDIARALGAASIYSTSGHRGRLTWENAADGFSAAMRPLLDEATAAGIHLLIEPTVPLHADKPIVHTLRDSVTLAERSGLGICIDIFHCWTEPGLRESIARAIPRTRLVQVGDYVFGDRAVPCHAVIGDGNIPIERMLGWILEDGYAGMFDLELNRPRIEAEGNANAVRRCAERRSEMLTSLGRN
ncbi:MAG: sugar phosphate isomerase/epimerase, partial [Betaproteobacteria bacterium]|nr:sugar phosphate isomerase/epimerase [Betaproteobacteria bacterium]